MGWLYGFCTGEQGGIFTYSTMQAVRQICHVGQPYVFVASALMSLQPTESVHALLALLSPARARIFWRRNAVLALVTGHRPACKHF